MLRTFEFGEWFCTEGKREALQKYLHEVWLQNKPVDEELTPVDAITAQPVLTQGFFNFDGEKARARNYIGFVQSGDFHLEIYPKVFKNLPMGGVSNKIILKHIFFWFDYCRKWKFPFTNVNLENNDCENMPELIMNLMANQILSVVSANPLMQYEEVQASLSTPRGRINFSRYINNGFSNGNQHILECDYEPLLFDNQLNRIIKYVTRQLMLRAKFPETRYKLEEILFVLDEVTDEPCNSLVLNKVKLNTFFEEYQTLVDICRLVLNQEIYSHQFDEQSHWSLLFPMEYIFEDFIAGFIQQEFSAEWKVAYQKSDMYLTDEPDQAFQMQHDLVLTAVRNENIKIIVDTKYKLRYGDLSADKKKGIAQSDMYQMTAYALRRACSRVILLYPNFGEHPRPADTFLISSGFDSKHQIHITAAEIPFWSTKDFSGLKESLKSCLTDILKTVV
jgi:5-methylcytosine-specific restriction enzyme subunit McrC